MTENKDFLKCPTDIYNYYGTTPVEKFESRTPKKTATPRVEKARQMYFESKSSASVEFPYWYTRKWEGLDGEIGIIRRAESLKCGFEHLTPAIFPGELLAMRKANYLRGSYPMPWLSEAFFLAKEDELFKEAAKSGKHSADEATTIGQGGGNVTKSAGNVVSIAGKFGLRKEEMPILLKIAKKWFNKSVDDVGHKYEQLVPDYQTKEEIMRAVICMFDSGYTLPQGREVMNYYYPLQFGIEGIKQICQEKIGKTAGYPDMDRLYFYKAVYTMLEGLQTWILNYAKEAKFMASLETDKTQKEEYLDIAQRLEWLSKNKPRTFHDALQLVWIFHVAVLNEDAISGLSPGRLGQVLYPFWKQDMEKGILNTEKSMELLECMRMKFTELDCFASMGVVGGVLSGNTFNNLCIGGLDIDGNSAANDLEVLILESAMTCDTPQPTLSLLYDEKLPEDFLLKGVECTKIGTGYPAWINNRVGMEFLLNNFRKEGMELKEARAWSLGGCLETSPGSWMPLEINNETYFIPGGSSPATSVGVHFISLPKVLEAVLYDGLDKRTGRRVYPAHGSKLDSYEEVWKIFKKYFSITVEVLTLTNNIQHDLWGKISPSIINSMLKPDCLEVGKDISNKGCRYNRTFNVEICGGVNLVNSLASIKKNIFDEKKFTLSDLKAAIDANFGYLSALKTKSYSLIEQVKTDKFMNWLKIHRLCLDAPKYGNDDKYVDNIFKQWQHWFSEMCEQYVSLYDEPLYSCQISVSTHAPMGAVTLASADGRLCGTTFADGSVSAYPGTDKNGPYALFNSATCYDHALSQNSQLNMKIHPSVVQGRKGSRKFAEMIKAYLRKGAFHAQFNVVDSRMLRDAQQHPENYRGLMVRVAGFTQYWVELGKQIQDEVIARTEYEQIG
ncbi:MAG: 4-hydroxyphenylacetate decarboxylase large subunit [Desulfobacteraceae bacterium]|nr:4-hydroxyphenylacetate decarboxylase large subunit [Desulfobacteraceae bacterium]